MKKTTVTLTLAPSTKEALERLKEQYPLFSRSQIVDFLVADAIKRGSRALNKFD